jgi:hypothetical protein
MVSSQLKNEAIIGCQFLQEYGICINFSRGCLTYIRDNVEKEHALATKVRLRRDKESDTRQTEEISLQKDHPITGQSTFKPTPAACDVITRATHRGSKLPSYHTVRVDDESDGSLKAAI